MKKIFLLISFLSIFFVFSSCTKEGYYTYFSDEPAPPYEEKHPAKDDSTATTQLMNEDEVKKTVSTVVPDAKISKVVFSDSGKFDEFSLNKDINHVLTMSTLWQELQAILNENGDISKYGAVVFVDDKPTYYVDTQNNILFNVYYKNSEFFIIKTDSPQIKNKIIDKLKEYIPNADKDLKYYTDVEYTITGKIISYDSAYSVIYMKGTAVSNTNTFTNVFIRLILSKEEVNHIDFKNISTKAFFIRDENVKNKAELIDYDGIQYYNFLSPDNSTAFIRKNSYELIKSTAKDYINLLNE